MRRWLGIESTEARLGALERQVHALQRDAAEQAKALAVLRAKVAGVAAGGGGVGDGRRVGLDNDLETLD